MKYPWTATEATPTLTGLPPHITILANFERLIVEMQTTKDAILGGVVTELDRRRIGSQSHYDKEEIILAMTNMHREVLKKVGECVRTSNALLQDVVPCSDVHDVPEIFVTDADELAGRPLVIANRTNRFQFFFSDGQMKRLPRNFMFPHMGLCALVVNWFCGNPSQRTMPLKFIHPRDLESKKMKCEYRKMKGMIGAVIAGAKELGVWDGRNGAWDVSRAMRLFESVQHLFEYPSLTSTRRNDQISWRTVYNLYLKNRNQDRRGRGHGRGVLNNDGNVEMEDDA